MIAEYLKLLAEREQLRAALAQAWEIGADHRKPTFEQLNNWHRLVTKGIVDNPKPHGIIEA